MSDNWDEDYEMAMARKRAAGKWTQEDEKREIQRQRDIMARQTQNTQNTRDALMLMARDHLVDAARKRNIPKTRSKRNPGWFHRTFKHSFHGVGRTKTFFRGKGSAQGGRRRRQHRRNRRKTRKKQKRRKRKRLRSRCRRNRRKKRVRK